MSSLNVSIYADASQAIEAFGRLKDRTTDLEKGFNKIGKSFANFGALATKTITVPIVASTSAMGLATKKAIDFDNAMREVYTLLPNLSKEGFNTLKNDVLQFSKEIGKVPEEVVPALYDTLSAGVPQSNVFDLYNVIPVASAIGVKFQDIGAAIAVMTAQGTPTSVATTQIRTALVELNKEGSIAYEKFKNITGVSFKEFIEGGGNLQEALDLIASHAKKNQKEVTSMFSSVEAGNAVLALSGQNAKKYQDALLEVSNSAGATDEAFSKIDDGAARSFEKIKAEVSALIIELGHNLIPVVNETLLPAFRDSLIPIAEKLIIKISNLIGAFNKLPATIQNTSIAFVTLVAGLGPALQGIVGLASAITSAKKVIGTFSATLTTLKTAAISIERLSFAWKALNAIMVASPILVTATAFGALAAAVYKVHKQQKELLNTTKELLATSSEMNKEAMMNTNLFEEYNKLAKSKELDTNATQRLNEVTSELISLYPNLKTKIIDGITYIDHARNKLENYRSTEEDQLIKSLEAKIKEWEEKKRLAEDTMNSASKQASFGGTDSDTQLAIVDSEKRKIIEYEKTIFSLKKQLGNLNAEIQARLNLSKNEINLTEKTTQANKQASSATAYQASEYKVRSKSYRDYLKELKEAEKEEQRRVANLRAMGKEISDSEALEAKKEKIELILSEMSSSLNLNSKQIKYLSDNYGYAFDNIKADKFEELVKEIEASIQQYERGVEVASQFGEEISELEQEGQKSEIVRSGIENIAKEIELTSEQVEILKSKFGDLYKVPTENISDYFRTNLADMAESTLGYANDIYSGVSEIKLNAIEREIDRLEDKKQIALDGIEAEKQAKLKAIGVMENSEKQSLLNSIKQIKSRQNVALGLYEQERLQEELKEKEQALAKIDIEEDAKLKQMEI